MKKYRILVVMAVVFTSCSVHKNSYQNKEEKLVIALKEKPVNKNELKGVGAILAKVVVKEGLNFVFDKLSDLLDKEKNKYSASYGGVLKINKVANKNKSIVVTRTVEVGGEEVKAMELKIDMVNNDDYVELIPKELLLNYSKAKITKESCVCRDDNESKVLLKVNLSIVAGWEDKIGEKHLETLVDTNFGFIKYLEEVETQEEIVFLDKKVERNWMKPIPKVSYKNGKENPDGGILLIKVNVAEIDGCDNEMVKLAKILKNSKDDAVTGIIDLTGLGDE